MIRVAAIVEAVQLVRLWDLAAQRGPLPKKPTLASRRIWVCQDLKKTMSAAADKLRFTMGIGEYMNIVLGIIFLKYISGAFDECQNESRSAHCSIA